jgi:hypothetical protein
MPPMNGLDTFLSGVPKHDLFCPGQSLSAISLRYFGRKGLVRYAEGHRLHGRRPTNTLVWCAAPVQRERRPMPNRFLSPQRIVVLMIDFRYELGQTAELRREILTLLSRKPGQSSSLSAAKTVTEVSQQFAALGREPNVHHSVIGKRTTAFNQSARLQLFQHACSSWPTDSGH